MSSKSGCERPGAKYDQACLPRRRSNGTEAPPSGSALPSSERRAASARCSARPTQSSRGGTPATPLSTLPPRSCARLTVAASRPPRVPSLDRPLYRPAPSRCCAPTLPSRCPAPVTSILVPGGTQPRDRSHTTRTRGQTMRPARGSRFSFHCPPAVPRACTPPPRYRSPFVITLARTGRAHPGSPALLPTRRSQGDGDEDRSTRLDLPNLSPTLSSQLSGSSQAYYTFGAKWCTPVGGRDCRSERVPPQPLCAARISPSRRVRL